MEKIKVIFTTIGSFVFNMLGALAVPVLLLVGCNIVDYVTGLVASTYRSEKITSYKSIRGIAKKICMWLLVLIASWLDMLLKYSASYIGVGYNLPFLVAITVSVWLVFNEMISILENMIDIGVTVPPFLMPLVKKMRTTTEQLVEKEEENVYE